MKKLSFFCALLLAFGLATPVAAEDGGFSANVTLATDYSFRGVSQTSRDPAIQGGFDYEFDSGFSIGTWASNVSYGDSSSTELDLYMGYGGEINESASWSASLIRFEYASEGDALDYIEIHLSFSVGDLGFGVAFSPEYVGDGGPTFWYPNASYSFALGESASLDLGIGISIADEDDFFIDDDSYIDYSATVTVPFEGLDLSFALVGTDIDADDLEEAEGRFIVSLSKSF